MLVLRAKFTGCSPSNVIRRQTSASANLYMVVVLGSLSLKHRVTPEVACTPCREEPQLLGPFPLLGLIQAAAVGPAARSHWVSSLGHQARLHPLGEEVEGSMAQRRARDRTRLGWGWAGAAAQGPSRSREP